MMDIKTPAHSLKAHFSADPFFLWAICIMMSINPVWTCCASSDATNLLYIPIIYCVSCLLATLFSFGGWIGHSLKWVTFVLVGLYDILALFCAIRFDAQIGTNIIDAILATNRNEIIEFLHIFVSWWMVLSALLLFALLFVLHYWCLKKRSIRLSGIVLHGHLFLLLVTVIVLLVCQRQVRAQMSDLRGWVIPFETLAVNLRDYEPEQVALTETTAAHPSKIVLIIGESHSKGHSSLYGYDWDTNPLLAAMVADSLAYVFSDVHAPSASTSQSFQYILNTRSVEEFREDWYRFPSIITIMHSAGYRTSWYSNQDEVGLHDNVASAYAHITDRYAFNRGKNHLDGELVEMYQHAEDKEFIVFHLMGQHIDFSKRYPRSFRHFAARDYADVECTDKDILAHYDNACLYNDFVVASLMQLFRNDDAIVFYFPDHGLDVYQSSPDYFGHAVSLRKDKNRYGYEIPFVVYTSPLFQKSHPDAMSYIRNRQDERISTADMPFIIMDVAGYKLKIKN